MSAATKTRTRVGLLPIGSYERVSKDKGKSQGKGSGLAVDRQRDENVDYLGRFEHLQRREVVDYTDNDQSGWDPMVTRPDFERLLVDIRAGKLAAVVAWHVDRFSRQPAQIEELWAACKESGTELHTVLGGHATSALMLRIQSALAAEESDIKSGRAMLKHNQLANHGQFHGGMRRFGYEPDMTIREDEAAAVRTIAAKLLNGESLASCARWLTSEGISTPRGGPWSGSNLGQLMKGAHLAGLRKYHGEVVADATWEAILTRADHEAIVTKLSDPARRVSFTNARVYLLAGLALCGECGAKIRGRKGGARTRYLVSYSCEACGGVHRNVADVDERVTDAVVARLAMMDARGVLAGTNDAAVELDRLTTDRLALLSRKEELGALVAAGGLSVEAFGFAMSGIESEETRLEAALEVAREAVSSPVRALDGLTGTDPRESFAGLALARQRQVIDLLFTVTIDKAPRKGAAFDPELVRVEPR